MNTQNSIAEKILLWVYLLCGKCHLGSGVGFVWKNIALDEWNYKIAFTCPVELTFKYRPLEDSWKQE